MSVNASYGSVETPDAQAAWEQWPVIFADPPASPDVALTTDAQERAQEKAAAGPPTNQRPSRQYTEQRMTAAEGSGNNARRGRSPTAAIGEWATTATGKRQRLGSGDLKAAAPGEASGISDNPSCHQRGGDNRH